MPNEILPDYDHNFVLGQEMESAIFQALGYASMCWSKTPKGVFDSEEAAKVGRELMRIAVQYAHSFPCEHTENGRRMRDEFYRFDSGCETPDSAVSPESES